MRGILLQDLLRGFLTEPQIGKRDRSVGGLVKELAFLAYNIKVWVWFDRGVFKEHLSQSCTNLHLYYWYCVTICITKHKKMVLHEFLGNHVKHEKDASDYIYLFLWIMVNIFSFEYSLYFMSHVFLWSRKKCVLTGF